MKGKIIEDKKIPHLKTAVDPEAMATAFGDFFSREYPDRGLKVKQCRINKVYHKPGKNCKITYYLVGEDQEKRQFNQWFYCSLSGKDRELSNETDAAPRSWPGCDFWKPVSCWPEMNMVIHAFPYDTELPNLGKLLEADFVKQRLNESLKGLGLTQNWQCKNVLVHQVRYRMGKSCLLRYEAIMTDQTNGERKIEFYGKTYKNAQSRYVYNALEQICASPACTEGRLNIPSVIAHIDEANTFWQHAWPGQNLNKVAQKKGWLNLFQSGVLQKIASLLADLHQVEMPEGLLHRGASKELMMINARTDADDISQFLPEKQEYLSEVIAALDQFKFPPDEQMPKATIHGTFKISQILCRDDHVAVVDFDSIAQGDPLCDLAEFAASLVYLVVSESNLNSHITSWVDFFLKSYENQVTWECDRQRLAWYVSVFLLGKIHASLKKLKTRRVKNIELAFDLLQEWLTIAKS